MDNNNIKLRIEWIDTAKGICISFVVLLHVYGESAGRVFDILTLFRMPLYFILSGMFFKTYSGFIAFIKKKINRLFIPFIITYIVICIPSIIMLNENTTINSFWTFESSKPNLGIDGAVWFLLCLFIQNIFFYLIFLGTKHNIYLITITSIIIGTIGYYLNILHICIPLWIDSAMSAMPFFLFGYLLKQYSSILNDGINSKQIFIALLSIITIFIVYAYNIYCGKNTISYGDNTFDVNIFCLFLGGLSGSYIIFFISKLVNKIHVISYIGRYSIVVLLTHLLYLFVIRNICYQLNLNQSSIFLNFVIFIFITLISIPTIKVCIKYLPYWFAQRDLIK